MKKPAKQKPKKTPDLTEAEIVKLLEKAGYNFVIDSKAPKFGKPDKDLNSETVIFPENSKRGIPIK